MDRAEPLTYDDLMDVMIQIPIIDLRSFLSANTGRLRRPGWPVGLVDSRPGCSQFVRGFGELRTTAWAETGNWEGRAQHVDARRAIKWPAGLGRVVQDALRDAGARPASGGAFHATCRARAFYGSQTSARNFLQIVIELQDPQSVRVVDWPAVAQALLDVPVKIARYENRVPLRRAGPPLVRGFLSNTTKVSFAGRVPTWAVTSGRPLIVGEIEADAIAARRHSDLIVNLTGGATVSYWDFAGVDGCLVTRPPRTRPRRGSRYSLHLSRLHSERVTLTKLAEAIVTHRSWLDIGRGSGPGWDLIQAALNDAARYLTREIAFGEDQRALLELLQSDLIMHAAEWQALHRVLRLMRPTVRRNVVEALTIVEGDQVTGDKFENISGSTIINRSRVQNAFNQLTADGSEDLRQELEVLLRQVETTADAEAADLAESFVEEAAGPKRHVILQTLWARLKEVAPIVGGLATGGTAVAGLLS